LEKEGVRQTITAQRITGCAHEEGVDYPFDGECPHCPFWHGRDRFTHQLFENETDFESGAPIRRTTAKIGRNDPCPCGSGKKYKKCCGA
jgi:preprotein translocase subunit SecA